MTYNFKKLPKKGLFILLCLLLSTGFSPGQDKNMIVEKTDGSSLVFNISDISEIRFSGITGIDDMEKVTRANHLFSMFKYYPNPAKNETSINFRIEKQGKVIIRVYNQIGKMVKELENKNMDAGEYLIKWDLKNSRGEKVSPGIYYYAMQFNNKTHTERLIIIN